MSEYATVNDVIALRGPQDASTIQRLPSLLSAISSQFRVEAQSYGKDLDAMVNENSDLAVVTKCLVVDGAMQYYYSSQQTSAPMTQLTESAGGYSFSGTFQNPGGGLYSKKTWLKLLGVNRQKVGIIEPFSFGAEE